MLSNDRISRQSRCKATALTARSATSSDEY